MITAHQPVNRWYCLECDRVFYLSKFISKKYRDEKRPVYCPHCGSCEYTVFDDFLN